MNLMDLLAKEEPPSLCAEPGWIWCHQQVKTLIFSFSLFCVWCHRNLAYLQTHGEPWFPMVCVQMFRLDVGFTLVMTFVFKFRIFGCLPRRGRHCPVASVLLWNGVNEWNYDFFFNFIFFLWLMGLSRSPISVSLALFPSVIL